MGSVKDFFDKKRRWSLLKDEIIDCYLTPYITKILSTSRALIIIDCFAGKGKFDSGEDGSPLIIGKHIKSVLENKKIKNLQGIFIEKKYAGDLKKNLIDYQNCIILKGTFEDNVENILSLDLDSNIFMYVDPYGPKSIPFQSFKQIRNANFTSLEVLINFNTIGFLREGCRVLKYNEPFNKMEMESDDLYEFDESNNLKDISRIANGDYWKDILMDYKNGKIDMFQAEEYFTNKYIQHIKSLFKYVVNIPIKLKTKNVPKYRLIFGTNHEDGLILMTNEMNKGWKRILEQDRAGQRVLFNIEFPDLSLSEGFNLEDDILAIIKKANGELLMKELIVMLIQKYGISFSERVYIQKLKKMENSKIEIERIPEYTPRGRRAISMDYTKYKIILRLK